MPQRAPRAARRNAPSWIERRRQPRPVATGPRRGPPGHRPRTAALFVLLCAFALVTVLACQGVNGPERARGVVVAVEARSIARADGITLRADDDQEYQFRDDPGVDETPGHLREHMALAEP